MKQKLNAILWDFDGVLLDSNPVREMGFRTVLRMYPEEQIEALISFHRENGGLSRYVKFRYFFEEVRREEISDASINVLAEAFSKVMRKSLVHSNLLIQETLDYVISQHETTPMYVVSGSDQKELRFLCRRLEITSYFEGIFGSPTPKTQLVKNILELYSVEDFKNIVLVGDSINDYEAAYHNGIRFMAYNNPALDQYTDLELIF